MKFLLSICFFLAQALTNVSCRGKMSYQIQTQWNSKPITHNPIKIELSWKPHDDFVTAVFKGPFFNDPDAPNGLPGKPFPMLWEYEVVEIFFLNSKTQKYLEVEVSPHGQHLILLLDGVRNAVKQQLPMCYRACINRNTNTWVGTAQIPLSYIPEGVDKMNSYAIHGSGDGRIYESLYPTPEDKYTQPDFHRLDYFKDFNIREIVKDPNAKLGAYWDTL